MTTWVNKVTVLPNDIKPGTGMAIKVVARVYDSFGGCWCAYLGASDKTDEEVADHGDEIPEEAALLLFPVMRQLELTYYNP
jgi:hypothetical protein